MADNQLNIEAINADNAGQVVEHLTGLGYVVRTTDDQTSWLNNQIDQAIKDRDAEFYKTVIDDPVKQFTGLEREGLKSSEYLKRGLEHLKTELESAQNRVNEYEQGTVAKDATLKSLQDQLNQAKENLKKATEGWETDKKNWQTSQFQGEVDRVISEALSRYRPKLRKFEDERMLENQLSAIVAKFKSENQPQQINGAIVWHDADGKPKTSQQNGNPLSAFEILGESLEYLIDKNAKKSGRESNQVQTETTKTETVRTF